MLSTNLKFFSPKYSPNRKIMTKHQVQNITPDQVHSTLKKNILADGYGLVFDPEKSYGSYIWDSLNNKEYLDMFSFYGSWPISHNHPKLNNPQFIQQLGQIAIHNPANSDVYTKELAQFVATFNRVCMPENFKHLFLISTGTLAVENALKTAFDWKTKKNIKQGKKTIESKKIIHFREAFHGRSGYSLSLTNTDPTKYMYFPLFDWPRIVNPKIKFPLNRNFHQVIETEELAICNIRQILRSSGDDIAAIILEPIQGEGGDNHFRPEFWQELRKLADLYHTLLIADEVQSGMGLSGKLWAHQHYGAEPDIICFGKKAQVCGIMCTDRIDEISNNVFVESSRINSTWGGNLVDMVRSTKIIEIIEEDNLIKNAEVVGAYLLDQLRCLAADHPSLISNVRGRGLMCAFDLPNKELCQRLIDLAYSKQLLIIPCGISSIRLRPLLDVGKKEIDKLIRILGQCLIELASK
jgi:L-lysine 6-transaminase